jgi:hypothetical protein
MNIGNILSIDSGSYASPIQTPAIGSAQDSDGDGSGASAGPHPGRHHHGGGAVGRAVMSALVSLGLTPPAAGQPTNGTTSTARSTSTSDGTDGGTASTGNVRQDMHQFLHALFDAMKNARPAAGSADSGLSAPGTGRSSFAAGLATVISEVTSGSAPAGLQDAFARLQTDLQGGAASSAGAGGSGAAAISLQALLSKLQNTLGYADTGSTAASGNIVSASA